MAVLDYSIDRRHLRNSCNMASSYNADQYVRALVQPVQFEMAALSFEARVVEVEVYNREVVVDSNLAQHKTVFYSNCMENLADNIWVDSKDNKGPDAKEEEVDVGHNNRKEDMMVGNAFVDDEDAMGVEVRNDKMVLVLSHLLKKCLKFF